jgi:DNA-binding transcriptional LysR family regulator
MDLELSWLEDFLAVIEAGGFSRAATRRHVTQPALSRRIRALEAWIGTPLFERNTHTVILTRGGAAFRPIAEDILRRVASGREEVLETAHAAMGTLRFAATHNLSQNFFPNWYRGLVGGAESGVMLQLYSANMEACERLLIAGEVHFLLAHFHAAIPTRLPPARFQSVRLGTDRIVPVSGPAGPGSSAPRFLLPGIADTPLPHLTYHPGSGVGRIVSGALSAWEQAPHLQATFTGPAMLLVEMARDGQGVTWSPHNLVDADLRSGRLRPAGGPEWEIPIETRLFRPRLRLSRTAELFWTRAKQAIADDDCKVEY